MDGKCPFHPTLTPEWIKEKNYFFRLSKYRDRLLAHFEAHPRVPAARRPPQRDPAAARGRPRGHLDEPRRPGVGHPAAVRARATWSTCGSTRSSTTSSAVGYGTDDERFAQWWPADLHVIGKDITRFHTVVWPAMLWSAGVEPPRQVFGHGWINYGGQRMSKTLGTSVDPATWWRSSAPDPARLLPDQGDRVRQRRRLHVGALRGALQRRPGEQPRQPGQPRHVDGAEVPRLGRPRRPAAAEPWPRWSRRRRPRLSRTRWTGWRCTRAWPRPSTSSRRPTASWPRHAPWALAKDPQAAARLDAVLFEVSEAVRVAATLLLPVMPTAGAEILRRLGDDDAGRRRAPAIATAVEEQRRAHTGTGPAMWPRTDLAASETAANVTTKKETTVDETAPAPRRRQPTPGAPAPARPRRPPAPAAAPADARIAIDDFMRSSCGPRMILAAEAVPKSKKLIRLQRRRGRGRRRAPSSRASPRAISPRTWSGSTSSSSPT